MLVTEQNTQTNKTSGLYQKPLGNTGIMLSKLGLGTVKFGRNTQVKYPHSFQVPSLLEITELLELSLELGINTLDTAPAYGDSEAKLGLVFADNSNSIKRENFKLISKAGEDFINNASIYNFSASHINTSIDNSLKNLNTDYLDILFIHSDGSDQDIANNDELWQALDKRKKQGDILAYGVSSKTLAGGLACLKKSDCAMITYREDYQDEKPLLAYAQEHNKGIILKKVLNSGHLGHSVAECLKFSGSHPAVTSMIIGTINQKHLCDLVKGL